MGSEGTRFQSYIRDKKRDSRTSFQKSLKNIVTLRTLRETEVSLTPIQEPLKGSFECLLFTVCIADLDIMKGERLATDLNMEFGMGKVKVVFLKCDVSNAENFKRAFESAVSLFSHIDVMVNNAGVHDETSWERMVDINLNGTIRGTNMALAHMRKDRGGKGGAVINVSSILGYQPHFATPMYTASKHGIIGFTRSLATAPDVGEQGVRFACICPNTTDTPILDLEPHQIRDGYYEYIRNFKNDKNLSPHTVSEALLSLIADDDSNDTLLQITLQEGIVRKKITVQDV